MGVSGSTLEPPAKVAPLPAPPAPAPAPLTPPSAAPFEFAPSPSSPASAATPRPPSPSPRSPWAASLAPPPPPKTIPAGLIKAILDGRCVAFVGSGFSQAAGLPTWQAMLRNVVALEISAEGTPERSRLLAHLRSRLENTVSGDVLDQVAQMLEDELGTAKLELRVAEQLKLKGEVKQPMRKRLELLDGIPFRAIVTTNYDELLQGSSPLDPREGSWPEYFEVLRGGGSARADDLLSPGKKGAAVGAADGDDKHECLSPREFRPIIKLHGRVEDAREASSRFGGKHPQVQALVVSACPPSPPARVRKTPMPPPPSPPPLPLLNR
jgi:hypothetical protein